MTAEEPRVLVVTRDASLSLGLAQLRADHRVEDRLEGLAPRPGQVVVIDLATLLVDPARLAEQGLSPDVLITDEAVAGDLPAGEILRRPCSVDALSDAIDRALSPDVAAAPPAAADRPRPATREEPLFPRAGVPDAAPDRGTAEPGAPPDVIDLTAAPEAPPRPAPRLPTLRRSRRTRGHGHRRAAQVDDPLPTAPGTAQRLRTAARSARELADLLRELPVLAAPQRARDAVVAEVVAAFAADAVVLWEPDGQAVRATAWGGPHGLSGPGQAASDHPLMLEVAAPGDGVLIDPVDEVPGALAGLGGTTTRTLMAVSLGADGHRHGVLTVGRDRPLGEPDLDDLLAMADEAGPLLTLVHAMAGLLERLTPAPTGAAPAAHG